MINAIIGSSGFIGSRLKWYADSFYGEEEWVGIGRENYSRWSSTRNIEWGKLIWAAGLSSKPYCNKHKNECFNANVAAVTKAIYDFNPQQFIYISSFDVYPDCYNTKEEEATDLALYGQAFNSLSWYGATKLLGERRAQKANSFIIVRCNGFTGPGLKKNVVYDIATGSEIWVSKNSKFQYMHTDVFAHLLFRLSEIKNNIIINFTSPEVVTPYNIASLLNKDIDCIKQPAGKDVCINAILDVTQLKEIIIEYGLYFPSGTEAIKNWNNTLRIDRNWKSSLDICRDAKNENSYWYDCCPPDFYRMDPGKPGGFL